MPSTEATRFVEHILACTDNPGSRSALRSGLGRDLTQADRMHAFVAPWTSSSKPHSQAVYYTIAALVARHRGSPAAGRPGRGLRRAPGGASATLGRLRPAASGQARAEVKRSPHPPCERCWRALPEVPAGGGLCARCKRAVSEAG